VTDAEKLEQWCEEVEHSQGLCCQHAIQGVRIVRAMLEQWERADVTPKAHDLLRVGSAALEEK
jgi:hypothetical protein